MAIAGDALLEDMLQAIPGDAPCGAALRHDPVFMAIRLDREEDDPTLPMGQWERPLKRADWPRIEAQCIEVLRSRSKDLQIVGWLLEAWLRQHELEGLLRGLRLMRDLIERHWESVHPQIEADGDFEARIAAIEWLNVYLERALRIHVTLVRVPDRRPPSVMLAEWDTMTASELADPKAAARAKDAGEGAPTVDRAAVKALAEAGFAEVEAQKVRARACMVVLDSLVAILRERMASDAPSLAGARRTLAHLERVLAQLAPDVPEPQQPVLRAEPQEDSRMIDPAPGDAGESAPAVSEPVTLPAAPVTGGWRTREEAYRTLEALADYLNRTEPHSPTPYLIRRAVNWGRMPLPELMAEIVREEGDLNRLSNILGMQNRE
jgi:type VI secretion system protein ImpA